MYSYGFGYRNRKVGGAANPNSFLTNPVYWHNAELSVVTQPTAAGISDITDLTGNDVRMTQAVEVGRPALIVGGINGHDAIDFEGVTEMMESNAAASTFVDFHNGTVSWTVGIVLRMLDNVDTQRISGTKAGNNAIGYFVNYNGGTGDFTFNVGNGASSVFVNLTAASLAINTNALLLFGYNSSLDRYEMALNDGTIATATPLNAESASDPAHTLTIGRMNATNTLNLDGYIAEQYGGTGISPTDAQADAWAWTQSYFGL